MSVCKGVLTGKLAIFRGISRMFHQHFQILSIDIITTLLRDDSDTSYAISHLKFPAPPWHIVLFSLCGRDSIFVLNVGSRLYFTREIALNDEYFSQFCPDRTVLWMTSQQLFEIFIKFSFNCIGAIFTYLHGASSTLGPFWVRELKKNWVDLPVLGWNRLRVLFWTS